MAYEVEAAGIEHPCDSSRNIATPPQSGAGMAPIDADLAAVVKVWPKLAEPIKAGILAMIRAAV